MIKMVIFQQGKYGKERIEVDAYSLPHMTHIIETLGVEDDAISVEVQLPAVKVEENNDTV